MLTALIIVLGLALLIGLHEASHMFVAKSFGVKVIKFCLGFGPKLLGKQIGETSYELRLLPLGGFVQFTGENPDCKAKRGFFSLPSWKRAVIALAGPLMNLALGFLMVVGLLLVVKHASILAALVGAWKVTAMVLGGTLSWIAGFFTTHASKITELSGPVAVTKIMVQSLHESFVQFTFVLSILSLSLGLFNLFPIPGLDGGHIFLYLLEMIRGKNFSTKVYMVWNMLAAVLLISLMVFVVIMDLLKH